MTLEMFKENFGVFLWYSFNSLFSQVFIRQCYLFIKMQFFSYLVQKIGLHMEIMTIIENLEVVLITKNEKGIGFCNFLGF